MSGPTCPWCGHKHPDERVLCERCDGPLRPPPGGDPGPPPSAPPRQLHGSFARRVVLVQYPSVLIGTLVGPISVAGAVGYALLGHPVMAALLGVLGVVAVLGVLGGGRSAWRELRALRHGRAVSGEIVAIEVARGQQVGGHKAWDLCYRYTVDGVDHEAQILTHDARASQRQPGDRIHVVVDPATPALGLPWPPWR